MREAIVETRGIGAPYQTLIKFGESGPRIHIFWRGDADPDHHDHPADFWTFPLTSYVEEYLTGDGGIRFRLVRAFRLHRRRAEFAHRLWGRWGGTGLITVHGPVVTLVWWGRKRREWGFHVAGRGWVPWKEYVREKEEAARLDAGRAGA